MIITKKTVHISEAAQISGIDQELILEWIENEWLVPACRESNQLDDEDLARARLIRNLQEGFGVNDESVSIILHLLDQIHHLHSRLRGAQLNPFES